jgi:hypothetical protein
MKLLSHVPLIKAGHLAVAGSLWNASTISPRFFEELANLRWEPEAERYCNMLADTVWLRDRAGESAYIFTSLRQLISAHARLVEATGTKGPSATAPTKLPFPAPPLPSTEGIEPITSAGDLEHEGKVMNHCAADYCADVAFGRRYIYRMFTPERATVGLLRRRGRWIVSDSRGRENQKIGHKAIEAINTWLAGAAAD